MHSKLYLNWLQNSVSFFSCTADFFLSDLSTIIFYSKWTEGRVNIEFICIFPSASPFFFFTLLNQLLFLLLIQNGNLARIARRTQSSVRNVCSKKSLLWNQWRKSVNSCPFFRMRGNVWHPDRMDSGCRALLVQFANQRRGQWHARLETKPAFQTTKYPWPSWKFTCHSGPIWSPFSYWELLLFGYERVLQLWIV